MRQFMDRDFLLNTPCAQHLYHDYAQKMPIVDYHCHISPKEIAENKAFDNITQIWLGGDHYKWRLMRAAGVDEKYITGDADDREKFEKWAQTLELAVGNPLYHWSHLELKQYFGYDGILNRHTAGEVWELCNARLKNMRARDFIVGSNVTHLCTTDDPADDLKWHAQIAADPSFPVKVLPAFRPDRALGIEKTDFADYMEQLGNAAKMDILNFSDWKNAIAARMDYFADHGCVVSDHGLDFVMYRPADDGQIEEIFGKRLAGAVLSSQEILQFKTACLLFLGREYHRRGWVMQLHYGVRRNNNQRMFSQLGPDTGYDCIGSSAPMDELAAFLDALAFDGRLPKTIVYSLNPSDNAAIGTIIGCFQDGGGERNLCDGSAAGGHCDGATVGRPQLDSPAGGCYDGTTVGKMQHGSAWWFNDNKAGIQSQLTSLANLGLLGTSVGMLTDSRSFLSYTRHEYYRRILCDLIGGWVENGEFPNDENTLKMLVENISYNNAMNYFNF